MYPVRKMKPEAAEKGRREALLAVGEKLFSKGGYRHVSVRDITESAGLGLGSFYTYFPSKETLYSEILDRAERQGIAEVERRVRSYRSPLNQLKALYRYTVLTLRSNEILRGIYAGEKRFFFPGLEARAARGEGILSRIEVLIDDILSEGGRKGVFRTDIFRNPKRMLLAIFSSLLVDGRRQAGGELVEDVMLLVERGLKRWLRLRLRDERRDWRTVGRP